MRKVSDLEKMRPNLADVQNLNQEIVALRRRQASIRSRVSELSENLRLVKTEISDCDEVITEFKSKSDLDNQDETAQIDKIRTELNKLTESAKKARKEKAKLFDEFRTQKRLMDFWKDVKKSVD